MEVLSVVMEVYCLLVCVGQLLYKFYFNSKQTRVSNTFVWKSGDTERITSGTNIGMKKSGGSLDKDGKTGESLSTVLDVRHVTHVFTFPRRLPDVVWLPPESELRQGSGRGDVESDTFQTAEADLFTPTRPRVHTRINTLTSPYKKNGGQLKRPGKGVSDSDPK